MKQKLEVIIKCDTKEQAADALEDIAAQIRGAGFDKAPNDIREMEDDDGTYGLSYETCKNDGTDIYGNDLDDEAEEIPEVDHDDDEELI